MGREIEAWLRSPRKPGGAGEQRMMEGVPGEAQEPAEGTGKAEAAGSHLRSAAPPGDSGRARLLLTEFMVSLGGGGSRRSCSPSLL